MRAFKLVEQGDDDRRVIRVEGEIDLTVADQLRAAIERARGGNELSGEGRRLCLQNASGDVERVLSMTGLRERFIRDSDGRRPS